MINSRASLVSRLMLLCGSAVALPTLLACLEHPLKQVELEANQEKMDSIAISVNKDVDILFVIDNSISMGEEQGNLSANFANFLAVLEADDVQANYRIGITTTDNGNPWCSGVGAAAGKLVWSNCRDRLVNFMSPPMYEPPIDQTGACLDYCGDQFGTIEMRPTTTSRDSDPKPRPWLESVDGVTNLPAGVTSTQALQCFGPQGIGGCGFEQHLESMYKALQRTSRPEETSYGFIRDTAILAIVFVTDEVDCSYNEDHRVIFLNDTQGGNMAVRNVFWSDPTAAAPTSAVCWNAGVVCQGAGIYDSCDPVDRNEAGETIPMDGNPEDNAVLHPLSRYVDFVQGIEARKRTFNPTQNILVAAISGVPEQYPDVDLQYSDSPGTSSNPNFVAEFGVGPGCVSAVAEAVPPAREREFVGAFGDEEEGLFSVCRADYSAALQSIANQIRDQIEPSCMPACVADVDVADGLQPECILDKEIQLENGDEQHITVPECAGTPEAPVPPPGSSTCYVELTIPPATAVPGQEGITMSQECVDDGWNLEFRLVEIPNPDIPLGVSSQISATCTLSDNRRRDCPALPS